MAGAGPWWPRESAADLKLGPGSPGAWDRAPCPVTLVHQSVKSQVVFGLYKQVLPEEVALETGSVGCTGDSWVLEPVPCFRLPWVRLGGPGAG